MKPNLKRLALLALVAIVSLTVYSQSTRKSIQLREMDKSKVQPVETASLLPVKDEDNKKETRDGAYWFNLGYSLHQSDRYIEAIEAFTHSIGLRHRQATSMYNVACGYALLNDKDNAIFWLNRSLAAGFDRGDLLKNDSDLDRLRSDARFKELVQKASFTQKDEKQAKDKTVSRLEDAVNNFERLSRESSQDGSEWYKIGSRLIRLHDYDRAITALTKAVENLPNSGSSAMYNLACAYALKGDRALGLEWLEKSINAGYDDTNGIKADPDIASLRAEPRFKNVLELSRILSLSQFNDTESEDSQFSKRRWAPAVKTYESFLRDNPANGRAWFNFGFALHYSSEFGRAVQAFEQAVQFGYRKPTSTYNIACGYSMMGNRDAAFDALEKARDAGFDLKNYILDDDDLANLRSDPRFKRFSQMVEGEHKQEKSDK